MFSVCKDHVAEQAQSAPLFDHIGQKRNSSDNDGDEEPSSKKRRQAHLLLKTNESSSPGSRPVSEGSGSANMNAQYTICHLCDLHFTSELDLEEHLYSLLHHRALEAEKGKEFVHECNLCSTKCKGLNTYVTHLREESHKAAVEERKEETKLNPNARVYCLFRYRNTFMNKSRKKVNQTPSATLLPSGGGKKFGNVNQNTSIPSWNQPAHNKLFQPAKKLSPTKPFQAFRFQAEPPPFHTAQPFFQPGFNHMRHNSSPPVTMSNAPWQIDPTPMRSNEIAWMESADYYDSINPYEQNANGKVPSWKKPKKSGPSQIKNNGYNQNTSPLLRPKRYGVETRYGKNSGRRDPITSIGLFKPQKLQMADLETTPHFGNRSKPVWPKAKTANMFGDTPFAPNTNKPENTHEKSKEVLKTSSTKGKKTPNKVPQETGVEPLSAPSEIYQKFRAVMEEIDEPIFKSSSAITSTVSNPSESSVFTTKPNEQPKTVSKEKLLQRTVTFEGTSESSAVQSNSESSFRARLCVSVMTGDLQEEDSSEDGKLLTLQLESPHEKSPLKDSKTLPCISLSTTENVDNKANDKSSAKQHCRAKNNHQHESNGDDPTASSVLSHLDALAKKKQAELLNGTSTATSTVTATSDVSKKTSESTCQGLSDDEQRKVSDMNRKKLNPTPNLSKARSRISSRQHKNSTSDSDNDKRQTRLANMFLKYGSRPTPVSSSALRSGKKNEKRKLSGPRFGIGLVLNEDENSHHSLDECDLPEITKTIHLVEVTPNNPNKRARSVSEGESSLSAASQINTTPKQDQPSKRSSLDSSANSFSHQLLQMSEREDSLHTEGSTIKQDIKNLQSETSQVNTLIEQLLMKKQSLSEELSKLERKEAEVNAELEKIRLHRLSLLRVTVGGQSTSQQELPSFHSDTCSHSTPTSSKSKQTPADADTSNPSSHSQLQCLNTTTMPKLEVAETLNTPVKDETSTIKSSSLNIQPFPVASNSEYFDANSSSKNLVAVQNTTEPSVDDIMRKYLQEASSERHVSSTTMKSIQAPNSSHKLDDCEVSSTTNPAEDHERNQKNETRTSPQGVASSRKSRKNRVSEDPQLAKLDAQHTKSNDATWSWVTAHSDACSSFQEEDAETRFKGSVMLESMDECSGTHEVHDASVTSLLVTNSGWIVSCSKDKTIKVTNSKSGVVMKQFPLTHVPITTHITMVTDEATVPNQEKVFIYVVYLEDGTDRTLLAESTVYRIHLTINLGGKTPDCKFRQIKIIEYNSSILCIHQSSNSFLYLGARDGRVIVCNHKKVKHVETLDCHSPHSICCLTSGTDGARRILCCGSSDCRISVRDAVDGLLLRMFTGHTKTVNSLQLVQNLLYSGSSDRTVLVHNIHTGELLQKFLGMHGGSIKMLAVHKKAVVTLCLDKSVRVLQPEPGRVSGPPKPTASLPLSLHLYQAACHQGNSMLSVPVACVGLQDGRIQLKPLSQISTTVQVSHESQSQVMDPVVELIDLVDSLSCLWSGCSSSGFTTVEALLNHIQLFHAPNDYPNQLDSCCLWDNCTLYFSAELDTSKDVRNHMEKHVVEAVEKISRNE